MIDIESDLIGDTVLVFIHRTARAPHSSGWGGEGRDRVFVRIAGAR